MGASLVIATVILAPFAALDLPRRTPTVGALAAVAALGVFCTAMAFVVYTVLVREAGTGRATIITYVNPLVAVVLGVTLLGERPGPGALAGLVTDPGRIVALDWGPVPAPRSALRPRRARRAARGPRSPTRPMKLRRPRTARLISGVRRGADREKYGRPAVRLTYGPKKTPWRSYIRPELPNILVKRILRRPRKRL